MPKRLVDFVVKPRWRKTDIAALPLVQLRQQMSIA
jgi:hypothetical protein